MKLTIFPAVIAVAALAACGDQPPQPRVESQPAASGGSPAASSSTTPPSGEERKEGANPVQGQVDPKQREQHKDFRQRGDQAGPTGPDTQPKN